MSAAWTVTAPAGGGSARCDWETGSTRAGSGGSRARTSLAGVVHADRDEDERLGRAAVHTRLPDPQERRGAGQKLRSARHGALERPRGWGFRRLVAAAGVAAGSAVVQSDGLAAARPAQRTEHSAGQCGWSSRQPLPLCAASMLSVV